MSVKANRQWELIEKITRCLEAPKELGPRVKSDLLELDDLLTQFFVVLERLEDAGSRHLIEEVDFDTHLMWHSAYCQMRAKGSTDFSELDRVKIFEKFFRDKAG